MMPRELPYLLIGEGGLDSRARRSWCILLSAQESEFVCHGSSSHDDLFLISTKAGNDVNHGILGNKDDGEHGIPCN